MALIVVPSEKALAEMNLYEQAMVRAQTLLSKKIPTDPDAHEKRFQFFTQAAMKAPFLALDRSESDSQKWIDQKMCVKDVLETVLPAAVMESITPKLKAIQDIMDGSPKIKSFTSFWYSHESGNKHVAQFCIVRIPNWDICKFEIYFVDIKASFSGQAVFGIASITNSMEVRYCFQQYSASTDFLLKEMETNPDQVQDEMEEWDKTSKSICPP